MVTRSTPVIHEFRVRLPRKLASARFVPPAPLHQPAALTNSPDLPASPVQPQNFWNTDAGRELKVDRERIEAVLGGLQTQLGAIAEARDENLHSLRRAAIELASVMATRLLHARIEAGEFPIEAKVRDMVEHVGQDSPVSVHLNPVDLELFESRLNGEPLFTHQNEPRIVADPQLPRGACRVENREGMLMSDLARELEDLRAEMLRSLDANPRS